MIKNIVEKIIGKRNKSLITELTEEKHKEPEVKTSHKLDARGYKFKRIQTDILYLPSDNGYKYLLVAVDNHSGLTDAIPLKKRNARSVRKALDKIFSNGILKAPKILQVDDGSEFKEGLKKHLEEKGIVLRVAGTNRHSQQSVVEARNKTFGSIIMKVQLARELESGKTNKKWIKILPDIISGINSNLKKPKKVKKTNQFKCEGTECNILNVGDLVRYRMDYPIDFKGKRLMGNFRVGDPKYSLKPVKIVKVLLAPDMPIRYGLEGITSHSFSKNQLKLVKNKIIKKKVEKKKKVNKPKVKWVDKPVKIKEGKRVRKKVFKDFMVQ